MTMKQLQNRLARIVRDLDTVSNELFDRGLGDDWERIESALTQTGLVCYALLDEKMIEDLPELPDVVRPDSARSRPAKRKVVSIKAKKRAA